LSHSTRRLPQVVGAGQPVADPASVLKPFDTGVAWVTFHPATFDSMAVPLNRGLAGADGAASGSVYDHVRMSRSAPRGGSPRSFECDDLALDCPVGQQPIPGRPPAPPLPARRCASTAPRSFPAVNPDPWSRPLVRACCLPRPFTLALVRRAVHDGRRPGSGLSSAVTAGGGREPKPLGDLAAARNSARPGRHELNLGVHAKPPPAVTARLLPDLGDGRDCAANRLLVCTGLARARPPSADILSVTAVRTGPSKPAHLRSVSGCGHRVRHRSLPSSYTH